MASSDSSMEHFERCLVLLQDVESRLRPAPENAGRKNVFEAKIIMVFNGGNEGFAFGPNTGLFYVNRLRCFMGNTRFGVSSIADLGRNVKVTMTLSNFPVHAQGYEVGDRTLKLASIFKFKAIRCWPADEVKPTEAVCTTRERMPSLWIRQPFSSDMVECFLSSLQVSSKRFENMIVRYAKARNFSSTLPILRTTKQGPINTQPTISGGRDLMPEAVKTTSLPMMKTDEETQLLTTASKGAVSKYQLFPIFTREAIMRNEEKQKVGFDLDLYVPVIDISDGMGVLNLGF